MDIRVLTLILLVSNCQCFLWNKVTPTPGPDVPEVGACPARRCSLKVNRTFSCPSSGCLKISDQIPKDTRIIRLQDNNITYIQRLAFPELTTLDLADNKISVIHPNAFHSLTKLKALYLSNNLIATLAHEHTYFATLINLEFLHISQNRLTQIGPGIFYPYLPNLKTLDLSYNKISIITSDCISDMVSLEEVKLNNNTLTNVTGRLHNLPTLRWLYLNQNKIKDLGADTFSDLPCLQTLDLSFNQISVIDDDTFTLGNERSQLELLNLKHNNIKVLNPQIFSRLASLKTLYLDYNSLIDVPAGVFPASLQTLTMSNMVELRIVHKGAFQSLRNIRTIEMANNRRLTLIQAGAFDPQIRDVSMIDLSGNNLAMLQEEVLQDWNEIESVDLSRNPWHCDGNIAWMLKVYMQPDDRHAIRSVYYTTSPLPLLSLSLCICLCVCLPVVRLSLTLCLSVCLSVCLSLSLSQTQNSLSLSLPSILFLSVSLSPPGLYPLSRPLLPPSRSTSPSVAIAVYR